jgi:hypothetical protein
MAEEEVQAAEIPDEESQIIVTGSAEVTDADETAQTDAKPASEDEPPSPEEPKKDKGAFQKRINELTGKWRDQERRATAAEERARALEDRIARLEGTALVPPRPKLEDFDSTEEFEAALEAHITAKHQYSKPEENAEATAKASPPVSPEADQAGRQITAKGVVLAGSAEAFAEAVAPAVEAGVFTEEVQLVLAKMDRGAEVAMHLGQDADAAARLLMAMGDPITVARELGRLEATLETAASTPRESAAPSVEKPTQPPVEPQLTKASEPIRPLATGKETGASIEPLDSDPEEVWYAKEEARMAAMRKR